MHPHQPIVDMQTNVSDPEDSVLVAVVCVYFAVVINDGIIIQRIRSQRLLGPGSLPGIELNEICPIV